MGPLQRVDFICVGWRVSKGCWFHQACTFLRNGGVGHWVRGASLHILLGLCLFILYAGMMRLRSPVWHFEFRCMSWVYHTLPPQSVGALGQFYSPSSDVFIELPSYQGHSCDFTPPLRGSVMYPPFGTIFRSFDSPNAIQSLLC